MEGSVTSRYPDIETFSQYSTEEMEGVLERISQENEFLVAEFKIMESYLNRINRRQQEKSKQQQQTNSSTNVNLDSDGTSANIAGADYPDTHSDTSDGTSSNATSIPSNLSKKKYLNKRRQKEMMFALSMENKIDIAHKEIEDMRIQMELENKRLEKEIEKMKAEFLEADLEIEENEKEMSEFKRDILMEARNPRDDSIIAEKFVKYLEDNLKKRDATLDKLRLKNETLKIAIRKAKQQLEQREDMGEMSSKIDFDQMKIENEQLGIRIEERNNELLKLKLTTGKTYSQLSSLQKKLNSCVQHKQWLKKQIDAREQDLQNLKEEIESALREKEREEKKNAKVKDQHKEVNVPNIIDYVHMKRELDRVKHEVTSWERKVEIAANNEKIFRQKYGKWLKSQTQ
jgi:hypothetical protein